MTRAKIPQGERKKVFFKIKVGEEYTEYEAAYNGLKIEGVTMGDKNDVRDVVRRIISARREPPERVVKAATGVVSYVVSAIHLGAKDVWGGMAVEFGDDERLKLSVNIYYYIDDDNDTSGWAGEVAATFDGYDGLVIDATHKVSKSVSFKEVNAAALHKTLLEVAKHAYNAWPSN